MELIYAVEKKYPCETRHQTALRIITENQTSNNQEVKQALLNSQGGKDSDQPKEQ